MEGGQMGGGSKFLKGGAKIFREENFQSRIFKQFSKLLHPQPELGTAWSVNSNANHLSIETVYIGIWLW